MYSLVVISILCWWSMSCYHDGFIIAEFRRQLKDIRLTIISQCRRWYDYFGFLDDIISFTSSPIAVCNDALWICFISSSHWAGLYTASAYRPAAHSLCLASAFKNAYVLPLHGQLLVPPNTASARSKISIDLPWFSHNAFSPSSFHELLLEADRRLWIYY